ncbi:2-deoxy-D-gluconate 3-dehydrogenase [Rhodanobacter fulvus Jip2]|uniref:2-dehydro-3-deoxy-D-gluconate 5-dehydrogenase n=1 Tax=Rhodanobacter fulvus Jip2 TaxID=1163408 RepID=I4VLB9_9GAMM|nr:2-dehydro-3-deoxy-D-gluconate 5-dehydrogenase KduD [Rhodanobacter fulvus]EIL88010.1 2-deoxy-D-gluconate 3-dehydrogenase [Rhodanobacter fulvus Jip2]
MNPFSLQGKVALVSGANTGLGQAMAIALAEAGADVAAVGRTDPADTAQAVRAAGRRFHWVEASLDTTAPIPAIIETVERELGGIDILVNNAGTIRRNDALDFSEDDWDAVMGVNLKTVFFLSQAVARRLVARKRPGKIVNIASMLSFQGGIRVASYTASKSGLLGLTRLLANEWAAHGINVNAIAPGYFETNNTNALRADEKRQREIVARIPAGRWGVPADLAGAVVFLASAASDYVHGTVLPVDGGWLAR